MDKESYELLKQQAERGDAEAACRLALALLIVDDGEKEATSEEIAFGLSLLMRSAEAGYAEAAYNLALAYYCEGSPLPSSLDLARRWAERAAAASYPEALLLMGRFEQYGVGAEANFTKAINWYEQAAATGVADAEFRLGQIYHYTEEVRDWPQALLWYERAAAKDHAIALLNLGVMLREGEACDPDPARAFEMYTRAAQRGVAEAFHNLGVLYEYGEGCAYDGERAVSCYMEAYRLDPKKYDFLPGRVESDRESIMRPPGRVKTSAEMLKRFPGLRGVKIYKGRGAKRRSHPVPAPGNREFANEWNRRLREREGELAAQLVLELAPLRERAEELIRALSPDDLTADAVHLAEEALQAYDAAISRAGFRFPGCDSVEGPKEFMTNHSAEMSARGFWGNTLGFMDRDGNQIHVRYLSEAARPELQEMLEESYRLHALYSAAGGQEFLRAAWNNQQDDSTWEAPRWKRRGRVHEYFFDDQGRIAHIEVASAADARSENEGERRYLWYIDNCPVEGEAEGEALSLKAAKRAVEELCAEFAP